MLNFKYVAAIQRRKNQQQKTNDQPTKCKFMLEKALNHIFLSNHNFIFCFVFFSETIRNECSLIRIILPRISIFFRFQFC